MIASSPFYLPIRKQGSQKIVSDPANSLPRRRCRVPCVAACSSWVLVWGRDSGFDFANEIHPAAERRGLHWPIYGEFVGR